MSANSFMPVKQAAQEAGVSAGRVYHWVARGTVPHNRGDDAIMRVSLDAIKAHLEKNSPSPAGEVVSMAIVGEEGVTLPGRARKASSSAMERRREVIALAQKLLAKKKKVTGASLYRLTREKGIKTSNRTVYEILKEIKERGEARKEARRSPKNRYGTFEYFCDSLRGRYDHDIKELKISSIEMVLGPTGQPTWTIRREQSITL